MKKSFYCLLVALLLISSSAMGQGANIQRARDQLDDLLVDLRGHNINTIEVIWLNPNAESRSTITPEMLDRLFSRKLEVRHFETDPLEGTLIAAFKSTSIQKFDQTSEGDVRWGVKFFASGRKNPVLSLYVDGVGETGAINGRKVSFVGDLHKWLMKNFGSCFESSRNEMNRH